MIALLVSLLLVLADDCTRCGSPLREGSKFCTQCGQKSTPPSCPKCRTAAEPKDRFCAQCGESLATNDDLARGFELLQAGDFRGALEHFTKRLSENPHRAQAYTGRARAYAGLGEGEKALADADRAIELAPNESAHRELRAELKFELGQDARPDLDGAIRLNPRSANAFRLRARYWTRLARDSGAESKQALERAIEDASRAVELDGSAASLVERGHVRLAAARFDADPTSALAKATTDFDAAIAKEPGSVEAWLGLGKAWIAVARLQESRRLDAKEAWNHALRDAEEAIRLQPKLPRALRLRARVYQALGRTEEAIRDFTQAIALHPRDAEVFVERGSALLQLARVQEAIADFDRALAIQPRNFGALLYRGIAKSKLGDLEGAIRDFTAALDLDPSSPDTLANRAGVRLKLGDKQGAAADFERALEVAPPGWPHRAQVERWLADIRK